jgi:hypothetical protein
MELRHWLLVTGSLLVAAPSIASNSIRESTGLLPSPLYLARAQSGVTNPIVDNLPDWSRRNAANADFVMANPSLLAELHPYKGKAAPVVLRMQSAGSYFQSADALRTRDMDTDSMVAHLGAHKDQLQSAQAGFGSRWVQANSAFSAFVGMQRAAELSSDGSLYYRRYRDLNLQLSVGGLLTDDPRLGKFEMGVGLKTIFRVGDEFRFTASQLASDLHLGNGAKIALAPGIDYGLLWTAPGSWSSDWTLQAGFVWRDLGTTQFLGMRTSLGERMPELPNNQSLELGLGLPNFRDGFRTALRVEYSEWTRRVSAIEKLGSSLEFRFPAAATLAVGLRGSRFSGGVGLRFSGLELELATASILLGEGGLERHQRTYSFEARGVF